jgi:hypothetical protein
LDQYDIYKAEVLLEKSHDERPVLILSPGWYIAARPDDDLLVAPISAQMDLLDRQRHFLIEAEDPEFPETHLRKTSYVALDYAMLVRREFIHAWVGFLDDGLRARFKEFWRNFYGLG